MIGLVDIPDPATRCNGATRRAVGCKSFEVADVGDQSTVDSERTSAVDSIAELNKSVALGSASGDFIRIAKLLAASGGKLDVARQMASQAGSARVREALDGAQVTKAGVAIGGLSDPLAWYKPLAEGFVGSMAEFGAFSRIWNAGDFYPVPMRTLLGILTSAPIGDNSAEGFAKAISSANFSTGKLEPTKSTATVVLTNELVRNTSPAAEAQFGREIRRAAAIALDTKFLAILAATSGATTTASTGITATAVLADLTTALNKLVIGADSRLQFICSPKLWKTLSLLPMGAGGYLMQGSRIGQITVVPSDAASTVATLIDSKQVAAALDNVIINASQEATLEMSDNPTSTDYQTISLFSQNLTALQAEIWWAALAVRGTAVTTLTGYS
jgi:hypothetical protein